MPQLWTKAGGRMSKCFMALAFILLELSVCAAIEAIARESYKEMAIALFMAFLADCCLIEVVGI